MKTGSIYIIKNKINEKVYVGQTTMSVRERYMAHMKPSTVKGRTYKLYNAIRKYGYDNFYYEILEQCIPFELLDTREIEYIEKFNSYHKGYNSSKGGDGRIINKVYDEDAVIERYINGESAVQIAKTLNVSSTTVNRMLHRRGIKTRVDGRKLDTEHMSDVLLMIEQGLTLTEIASTYGVDKVTVRRFLARHNTSFRKVQRLSKASKDSE